MEAGQRVIYTAGRLGQGLINKGVYVRFVTPEEYSWAKSTYHIIRTDNGAALEIDEKDAERNLFTADEWNSFERP